MKARTQSDNKVDKGIGNQRRALIGSVLFVASALSLLAAIFLESFGLVSADFSPVSFVGAVVFLKLGLFSFWPVISKKGREASSVMQGVMSSSDGGEWSQLKDLVSQISRPKRKNKMVLWDENDPRLDLSLFSSNVPTFVLNHEQRFLDWNIAFELVFGESEVIKRGHHVSRWFGMLDNFKNVSKREHKLFGEGILPMADRERATFISPRFGRMVFTKIMTPIVDADTGKVVGWNIVLNINSVAKRSEFFDLLYKSINEEVDSLRYVAAHDGIFREYPGYRRVIRKHVEAVGDAKRVFDLGAGTGNLTLALLKSGKKVDAVERDVHCLRRLREKCEENEALRIIRQDPKNLRRLPEARYDAAVMMNTIGQFEDPLSVLRSVSHTMKSGAILSISLDAPGAPIEDRFNLIRDFLVKRGKFDNLKHQFRHVLDYERKNTHRPIEMSVLRPLLEAAGFEILDESGSCADAHTQMVKARKIA